jgi:uncharacterized protein DUF4382
MRHGEREIRPWLALALCIFACLTSCGGGSGGPGATTPGPGTTSGSGGTSGSGASFASVTVTISDPTVCGTSMGGPFKHIYVTITDVQAFANPTSAPQDGISLTSIEHPVQIDLLGTPTSCALATLKAAASVPTGTYQELAVFLAASNQASQIPGGTKCPTNTLYGVAANCAVLADGSAIYLDPATTVSQIFPIPATRIAGGEIKLANGSQTLNIDFDACASMYSAGGGNYGIDPTMYAALMPSSGKITGRVLDLNTNQPIAGDTIVALEQPDTHGIDREIMEVAPGPDGSFVLCPVPAGKYDVVAVSVSEAGVAYGATITTEVQPGASLEDVLLQPAGVASQALATISGQVTAAGPLGSLSGYTHILVSALQSISRGSSTVLATVPLASQYSSSLRTVVTGSNTYLIKVPAANPRVGTFVPNGATRYEQDTSSPASYEVDVQSACSPSTVRTVSPIQIAPGASVTAPTLPLTDCPPA